MIYSPWHYPPQVPNAEGPEPDDLAWRKLVQPTGPCPPGRRAPTCATNKLALPTVAGRRSNPSPRPHPSPRPNPNPNPNPNPHPNCCPGGRLRSSTTNPHPNPHPTPAAGGRRRSSTITSAACSARGRTGAAAPSSRDSPGELAHDPPSHALPCTHYALTVHLPSTCLLTVDLLCAGC
eukprot:scaffold19259_cov43-Phaeocystis_antarctica.AAC.3